MEQRSIFCIGVIDICLMANEILRHAILSSLQCQFEREFTVIVEFVDAFGQLDTQKETMAIPG